MHSSSVRSWALLPLLGVSDLLFLWVKVQCQAYYICNNSCYVLEI